RATPNTRSVWVDAAGPIHPGRPPVDAREPANDAGLAGGGCRRRGRDHRGLRGPDHSSAPPVPPPTPLSVGPFPLTRGRSARYRVSESMATSLGSVGAAAGGGSARTAGAMAQRARFRREPTVAEKVELIMRFH